MVQHSINTPIPNCLGHNTLGVLHLVQTQLCCYVRYRDATVGEVDAAEASAYDVVA